MLGFGKLFVMYNQRTYHKTVQMWTEAVCRYIYEFYRQSIRTLLAFLTEVCFCAFFSTYFMVITFKQKLNYQRSFMV